jgi:hypothetical protein
LLGSRNKKTLAALAAAADVASAEAMPATAAAVVPAEATVAVTTAAASIGVAPAGIAAAAAGGSAGAAAGVAHKPRHPPVRQRLSYTSKHGFTTFLAPLRGGCKVHMPLPFRFVDTMGGNPLMPAIVEEGSGGQPLYPVEVYHDDMGKSYLRDGWPKFIEDYDLKMGWSLIFTRCAKSHFLCVRVVDTSGCARAYSAWP